MRAASSPTPRSRPAIDARGRVPAEQLWRALHEADVLCAPSLAGESFGMILTEAFAAGHAGDRLQHRRLRRRRHRRRRRRPRPAGRPAAARRGASARRPRAARASRAMGEAARESAAALRLASGRRAGRVASTTGSSAPPAPDRRGRDGRVRSPPRARADRRLAAGPGAAPALARPDPGAQRPRAGSRGASALGVAGAARRRAHLHRRAADRRRQRGRATSSAPTSPGCWSRRR